MLGNRFSADFLQYFYLMSCMKPINDGNSLLDTTFHYVFDFGSPGKHLWKSQGDLFSTADDLRIDVFLKVQNKDILEYCI